MLIGSELGGNQLLS